MAYLRKFHNRTRCTMVPTDALRQDLQAAGFRDVAVVSRGVDTRRFDPLRRTESLRAEWGAAADDVVVACVGRLAPEKNLGVLMTAFEAIRRTDLRAKLLLVGDGPMREELRSRCPDAVLAGQRTGDDLAAHYASADLFLFPSLTETFGNVTAEAMASGLPVVAFDYAAAAQLIGSGENGIRVPLGDTPAFVRSAVALAHDRAQRLAMGRHARLSACELGWESVVARFEAVLSNVIRGAAQAEDSAFPVARRRAV